MQNVEITRTRQTQPHTALIFLHYSTVDRVWMLIVVGAFIFCMAYCINVRQEEEEEEEECVVGILNGDDADNIDDAIVQNCYWCCRQCRRRHHCRHRRHLPPNEIFGEWQRKYCNTKYIYMYTSYIVCITRTI